MHRNEFEIAAQEIPEIGAGLGDEYREIGASLALVSQKLAEASAPGVDGMGPETAQQLKKIVDSAKDQAGAAQLKTAQVRRATVGGIAGRSESAQSMPISDPTAGAIILAPGATVPFVCLNPKGTDLDFARLRVSVVDPATALAAVCGIGGLVINGDGWGDGNEQGTDLYAPQAIDPIIFNRRLKGGSGSVTGNLINNTAIALEARVTAICYPCDEIVTA